MSEEIQSNIKDFKANTIRSGDVAIIASQTGIEDTLYIERVLMECNNDIAKTILSLLGQNDDGAGTSMGDGGSRGVVSEPTVFDQIRIILNEKDAIYQAMKAYKGL
jgi:hypothetical protein